VRGGKKQLFLKRTGNRANQRGGRLGIGAAFKSADQRAKQLSNNRSWRREGLTSKRTAISGVGYAPPPTLSVGARVLRILGGLLILPLCAVTTVTLFQRVTDPGFAQHFWKQDAFIYFVVGFVLNAGWFLSKLCQKIFLYLYVLGHELTHAVFVVLCFGKVSGFRVGIDGGHVVTNKSNLLIALSPYFVPFWSLVTVGLLSLITYFFPFPGQENALFAILGATWSFHIFWTLWIIPRDQPDLKENGTFLSLNIIYIANVVLLSGLLCLASPNLSWRDFVYNWANNCLDLVAPAWKGFEGLVSSFPL
jgi:hypothetical protein